MLVAADCLDILAVDSSRIALGEFLEAYEPRYHAACVEFETWDRDNGDEWTSEHERKLDELTHRHRVHGAIVSGTTFRILESLGEM